MDPRSGLSIESYTARCSLLAARVFDRFAHLIDQTSGVKASDVGVQRLEVTATRLGEFFRPTQVAVAEMIHRHGGLDHGLTQAPGRPSLGNPTLFPIIVGVEIRGSVEGFYALDKNGIGVGFRHRP